MSERPLADLGRSRASGAEQRRATGFVKCSYCGEAKPVESFSKRQLATKGRCGKCADLATQINLRAQASSRAEGRQKRLREELMLWEEECVTDDEYVKELLQSVDDARAVSTNPSSRDEAIDELNQGHRLLRKLGWELGSGLGARGDGDVLPLASSLSSQQHRRGLGIDDEGGVSACPATEQTSDSSSSAPFATPAPDAVVEAWREQVGSTNDEYGVVSS